MITIFGLYRAKDHDKGKQVKKSLYHQVSKCFMLKNSIVFTQLTLPVRDSQIHPPRTVADLCCFYEGAPTFFAPSDLFMCLLQLGLNKHKINNFGAL